MKPIKSLMTRGAVAGAGLAALVPMAAVAHAADTVDTTTTAADTAAAGGVLAGLGVFFFIFVIIGLAFLIFWIMMLIDAIKRTNWQDDSQKTTWIVVLVIGLVVGLGWLAVILYYFMVKKALDKGGKSTAAAPAATPAEPAETPAEPKK